MDFTLGSGAKLTVSIAPFQDSLDLNKAILESIKGLNLSGEFLKSNLKSFNLSEIDLSDFKDLINELINKILSISTSEKVEKCIFKCAERATYENVRVTKDLFDDVKLGQKARADYYEICLKIIEVNCSPFFAKTFSGLKQRFTTITENLK